MINLLPPDTKQAIFYAKRNTLLLKWLTALTVAIIGVFIVVMFGQFYITRSTDQLLQNIDQTEQGLAQKDLQETKTRVQEISDSLNLVVQVLSQQVLFSDLIRQVGGAIPSGAVLSGLTINETEGGIDLLADATDYNTATQVQVNLEDPANEIFASSDIINVRCEQGEDNPLYPCQITIRALFGENSQFLLIPEAQADVEGASS
jgi:hypothetical protein